MKHLTEPVDPHNLVMEWHEKYGVPVGEKPALLEHDRYMFRMALIEEELDELVDAASELDLIEMADALGDAVYVIYGFAIEMGINLSAVMLEIQRSNMSKLGSDGKPVRRADGKILKGPDFSPPDLKKVLGL